ncbi:MAG TPA: VWA domain-containing protein [Bryobacteraceae bacterium]|jgi:VWFA-related protein|nr:VWA domain-containing protein [Bryobacteraceae bacterium]
MTFWIIGLLFLLAAQNNNADADELLKRGIQLLPSKPAEAVKVFQQALRLDPDLPSLRYELGLAYHAIGDEADAEPELREAVKRAPDSAEAHNYLGIVLFQLSNAKAALEEFRAAARLAPQDPNAHFNLGESLARTGDSKGALEELRIAAGLTPSDAGLARLLKNVEATQNTIKVDVRQVLVPAVVTDREGHYVTSLTQEDFKIFEDGVEQKITAFSVESSGLAQIATKDEPAAAPPVRLSAPPTSSAHTTVRRTYMICIDTLHASFNHFVAAREALAKLFQQEHSEDSQYVVVALGASAEMVLNITHDPAAVLAVFQNKRMQKIFLDGQMGGLDAEMERFRRDLVETRLACDHPEDTVLVLKCQAGILRANQEKAQIAELDRTLTVGFLREFRALILQLARARDRRTVVLISDGFGIDPGREAYELVEAFALASPKGLRSPVRMQNEFEPILQLAAMSNITVDTIDSRGLYGQRTFDASNSGAFRKVEGAVGRVERNADAAKGNTLAEIAEATGGTAFHDSNDLLGGLQRAFADGRDYYTIGYVSSNENLDGKFRAITVQVRGRDVTVKAKRGYWAAQ